MTTLFIGNIFKEASSVSIEQALKTYGKCKVDLKVFNSY